MTESPRPPWEEGADRPGQDPSGGYPPPNYPPGGGYQPPGGYGYGPGPEVPPPGYPTSDDKTWALLAHFGGGAGVLVGGVFGWVMPLITLLTRGNQSPTVRAHALAALNFQTLWAILNFVAIVLGSCLFWLILPILLYLVPAIPIIFGLIGGLKANNGELYRYPASVNWIK